MMTDYILETRELVRRSERGKNQQTTIDQVSLRVETGKIYGLLGPNGAGKPATLKMITGMLRPTAGEIRFQGHPWERSDLYHLGALVEQAPLYPNLSARENLEVRTTLLELPKSGIERMLEIVSLADTGRKHYGKFSMGMKQRLDIALALLGNPRLLILGKPTNGLDPVGIEELWGIIHSFPKRGITVLLSSCILTEVQRTTGIVGIIVGGELAYEQALRDGEDLEALLLDVCRKGGIR